MTIAWGKRFLFSIGIADEPDRVILGHQFQCRVQDKTLEGIYGVELDSRYTFAEYSNHLNEHGFDVLYSFAENKKVVQALGPTMPAELIPHCPEILYSFEMFCRRARTGNPATDTP